MYIHYDIKMLEKVWVICLIALRGCYLIYYSALQIHENGPNLRKKYYDM
jgi:hypothetical protein